MADISLNELIDMLSELFTNLNNLDKTYYDMFYNQTPMDITLERYDENGVLHTYEIPNRAKDRDNIIIGEGNPEGEIPASMGKLYMDTITKYLYYKTEGTIDAPTSTGWITILTSESIGNLYQSKSEKGQPNGYASLDEDGIVTRSQLPKENLTYAETSEFITINILLQTTLTIVSSNTNLEIENNYTGTMDEVGTIVKILTEETSSEYIINNNVANLTGDINIDNMGVATDFSAENYISTNLMNTELVFTTGNVNEQEETLCVADGRSITIQPSETTLNVVADPDTLVITNNYDGTKPIGTETVVLEYRDAVIWNDSASTVQGTLDVSAPEVSGFSTLSYIMPTLSTTSTTPIIISFNTGDEIQEGQVLIGAPMSVAIKDGYLGYNKYSMNEFEPIVEVEANTKYYIKINYDTANQTSIVQYSTDGTTWTQIVPAEDGGLFIIDSYIIGKGQLDGRSNVPFLGTVNSLETYIDDTTPNYFASIVSNWYEEDTVVQLSDYDLVLSSGTPVAGNSLTLTYTTPNPTIGSEYVDLDTEYQFRWNNTGTYTFIPQLYKDDEWVTIGAELATTENTLEFTKGLFNGSFDLLASTTMNSDLETTQYYSDIGDVVYGFTVVSGFSQDNYLTMDTPTVDGDLVFNITTGTDVTTQQVLVENNYNDLQTALTIDTGKLHYIIDGTDYETNMTVVDANTNYLFKFTRTSGAWTASFSTDGDTWTALSANDSTSFDDLFKDAYIDMFKVFDGTVNVGESTVTTADDGVVPLFTQERVDIGDTETFITMEYHYNWYEGETLVDLADYDIAIISGTPESGDTLTLTYVTTEAG